MPEVSKTHMGGTMRLGLRPTIFEPGTEKSSLRRLYGNKNVAWERHRHRYEVEPNYVDQLETPGGLRFVGKDERGERMQMLEIEGELLTLQPSLTIQATLTLLVFRPTPSSARVLSTRPLPSLDWLLLLVGCLFLRSTFLPVPTTRLPTPRVPSLCRRARPSLLAPRAGSRQSRA